MASKIGFNERTVLVCFGNREVTFRANSTLTARKSFEREVQVSFQDVLLKNSCQLNFPGKGWVNERNKLCCSTVCELH